MPIFDSAKGDIPWNFQPSSAATQMGSSQAAQKEAGTLNCQVSGAGVSPSATGGDNVLAIYTLPASAFDAASRGILIAAQGAFAANGNNKRVKIFVGCTAAVVGSTVSGGTAIADTGTVTTNNAGWSVGGMVYKYGAAASNTQIGVHQQAQIGAAVSSMLAPQALTLTENAPIIIAITGNATTTATDIVLNLLTVEGFN